MAKIAIVASSYKAFTTYCAENNLNPNSADVRRVQYLSEILNLTPEWMIDTAPAFGYLSMEGFSPTPLGSVLFFNYSQQFKEAIDHQRAKYADYLTRSRKQ